MFASLVLTLLNVGLVVAPIGGAVGTLAGIDYYRRINGQEPLWYGSYTGSGTGPGSGGSPGGGGGGGGGDTGGNYTGGNNYTWPGNEPNKTTTKGGVTISEYCQQYATVNFTSLTGQNYTLNPNQWGLTKPSIGGLCMNVTSFNNHTYATNTTAPQWSATWKYKAGPKDQPVHAYPNIKINGDVLPIKLSDVNMLRLDVLWAYIDAGTAVVGTASGAKTWTPKASSSTISDASTTKSAIKASATPEQDTPAAAASTTTAKAAAPTTATTKPAAVAVESPSSAAKAAPSVAKVAPSVAKAPVSVAKAPSSAAEPSPAATSAAAASKPAKQASTTTTGTKPAASKAIQGRSFNDVTFSANVAVDMFFDANAEHASLTGKAAYEVMVWLAQFGEYTDPIGIADGPVAWQILNGVNFTLFAGINGKKQHVLTWIAETAAPAFNGSILPLITTLPSLNLTAYPTSTDYIGYFAFGSETSYSVDEVTFDVEQLAMDIW
ncbi:MAG: hypothetical protein SEPTF4163_001734 [Sporothrix epigloea]